MTTLTDHEAEVLRVIDAFNNNPNCPYDVVDGKKVYYVARLPILAEDCDYEIVTISGVQGKMLPKEL